MTLVVPPLAAERSYRVRFDRHVRFLSQSRHPAAARVLGSGETRDGLYLVTEPWPGITLGRLLAAGPLTPWRALSVLNPVATLLDSLHAQQLIAGDLSSEAVVVGAGDRAKLPRPGLADSRSVDLPDEPALLRHAAPERLRGLAPTPRTDIFALGTVLFEAITGIPPFDPPQDGEDARRVLISRWSRPIPLVADRRLGLGEAVDAVFKRALAEVPAERPTSCGELMHEYREALERAGVERPSGGRDVTGATRRARHAVRNLPEAGAAVAAPSRRRLGQELPAAWIAPATDSGRAPSRGAARGRSAPSRLMRVAVPGGAVALLTGVFVAMGREPATPFVSPPESIGAASRALAVSHPSNWQSVRKPPGLQGLPLRDGLVLVPRPGVEAEPASRFVAGVLDRTGPGLLPAAFSRRLPSGTRPEAVRIGGLEAYRYRDIPLAEDRIRTTLYAIPTTDGVAALVCLAPRFRDELRGQCEAIATTLELRRAQAVPLGPNVEYGRRLNAVLAKADAGRSRYRSSLARARGAAGQSRRADDLARVFTVAAARLADGGPEAGTAPAHRAILRGLRRVARSYASLSRAADAKSRGRYARARRRVMAHEKALRRTLKSLRDAGYRVR